jgi:hypothetical protein
MPDRAFVVEISLYVSSIPRDFSTSPNKLRHYHSLSSPVKQKRERFYCLVLVPDATTNMRECSLRRVPDAFLGIY